MPAIDPVTSPTPTPTPTLVELQDRLAMLMGRDQRHLRRRLDRARQQRDEARATALAEVAGEVEAAERRVERRRALLPTPTYPPTLPVTGRKDDILAAIRDNQVIILAGETGSGKSTQLPKICLELGRGVLGLIGHTQPRRLAARAVAERVAEELGSPLGELVGYTVRFTDRVGDDTLVKLMTDGILLAEIQRDRSLSRYDTLIIDEAHERSLNIDFILGYLSQLLPRRPDLKVIVTSATIDTERFSQHFGGAPVIDVTGRSFPVEVRYRPVGEVDDDDEDDEIEDGEAEDDSDGGGGRQARRRPPAPRRGVSGDRDQTQAIRDAVDELCAEGPGDILVFLSGEREIRDTADALRDQELAGTEILPLYARLSAAEQHRVFAAHKGRRVVLATNVAETSLTVPGIRYVVDPGTARISRYNRRTKVQRLPIEAVSQASANQRAGRCGRVAPGVCIRLYAEEDFESRPEFTEPEILRTNLASVILQMASLGLGDVASFPFVDPPDARTINDGVALLEELGALDPDHVGTKRWLTPRGRDLAQLPLDPRLGRMVLEADRNGCVREVMIIAAALSIQDPRERPTGKQQAAAERHRAFVDEDSDFTTLLNLWDFLQHAQRERSSSAFRRLCKAEYLNYLRVREWQDIYSQLRQVVGSLGIKLNGEPGEPARIHRSLLAGLLSHLGLKDTEPEKAPRGRDRKGGDGKPRERRPQAEYQGAHGARFVIAPGSSQQKHPPRWIMTGELVETNRLWARVNARIQPEWAEDLGGHLLRRSYSDPHWDARRGAAVGHETVTLYGLPIVANRRIDYARVDPDLARDLFLHHALVERDWTTHHRFLERNQARMDEVRALEDRVRRHGLLVGENSLFDLYDARVGPDVTSGRTFDRWWKHESKARPDLLDLTLDELTDAGAEPFNPAAYPDVWTQGGLVLPLTYAFAPGTPGDGVTVHVPLAALNQVTVAGFDWHVPGRRDELVTALIRTLPKNIRRTYIPAPDVARTFLAQVTPKDGGLLEALEWALPRLIEGGAAIPPGSWDVVGLPDHVRLTFSIEDEHGQQVAVGKDLTALQTMLLGHVRAAISRAAPAVERSGLTDWTVGELPRVVEATRSGHRVRAYPALVDEGDSVAVRMLASVADQERAMVGGTRRLLLLTVPSVVRALQNRLTKDMRLAFARSPYRTMADLIDDAIATAADELVAAHGGPAWDEAGFRQLQAAVKAALFERSAAVLALAGRILGASGRIEARLDDLAAPALRPAVDDVREQLAWLVHPGFLAATGTERLAQVPRYLEAISRRLDKLTSDAARDRERMARVQRLEREYAHLLDAMGPGRARHEAEHLRWMVEELRVSLFAQALGTPRPVSEERILRAMDDFVAS